MNEQNVLPHSQQKDLGDWAVDGLISGIGAGAVMLLYMLIYSLITGLSPVEAIGRFDPAGGNAWLSGLLAHLAVSGIYGLLFAVGWSLLRRFRSPGSAILLLAGALYGLLLYGAASVVLLNALDSPLRQFPPVQLAIAHVLYGLLLAILLRRRI